MNTGYRLRQPRKGRRKSAFVLCQMEGDMIIIPNVT